MLFLYGEYRIDEAFAKLEEMEALKNQLLNDEVISTFFSHTIQTRDELEAYWTEKVTNEVQVKNLYRDKKELDIVLSRLNDEEGFREVINNKKKGLTMWVRREEGMKGVTFKFEARNIKMHLFNLLALINETDLYDLWFP